MVDDDGSTANTATLWPPAVKYFPNDSINVLLPAPGGPESPIQTINIHLFSLTNPVYNQSKYLINSYLSLLFFVFICLTSGLGDACPGFQSQGGYVSTLACRFLRLCTIALDLQGVFLQVGRGLVLKVMKIRIPR